MDNFNKNRESTEGMGGPGNGNLRDRFIREFTKIFLVGKDKAKFIDEVMGKESIEDSELLKRKLKAFKAYNDDFKNFDESKISIFDLKRQVSKEYISLKNSRELYQDFLKNNFDLSDEEISNILKSKDFLRLDEYCIDDLLKDENKNKAFLKSILKKEIRLKNQIDIFKNLTDEIIRNRLNNIEKISPDLAKNIKIALLNISEGKVNNEDFRYVFSSGFFSNEEKKEIFKKFIPYLTLEQAKKYGLLNDDEIKKYKRNIVESYINSRKDLNNSQKKQIAESIALGDIKLPSYIFLDKDENIEKIAEFYDFSDVAKSLNNKFDKVLDSLKEESSKELLKEFGIDIKKLKKDSILRVGIPELDKDGKVTDYFEEYFWEIKDINDKEITLKEIGKNDDIHFLGETRTFSYKQLQVFLKKQYAKLRLFSKQEFKEFISDENSKFDVETSFEMLKDPTAIDRETKENIKQDLIQEYENQKQDLEKELKDLRNGIGKYAGLGEEDKQKKEKLIQGKIEALDEIITKLKENKIDDEELLEEYNFSKFLEELDFIDKQGKKLGFEKGIFIELGKGLFENQGGGAYEVADIDKQNGIITLNSLAGKERVDYENFLKVVKKEKAQRKKKIENFDEILNNKLNENHWKNIKIKDGRIIEKDAEHNGEKKDREVDFLISDDNDEVIKINEIQGDKVLVQFGERKDLGKDEKKAKKYGEKDKVSEIKLGDEVKISLNELNKYINDYKLYPDWKTGKKELKIESQDLQNNIKGSFSTRLFNRYSISELIAGGKLMISGIEEYLKKGNDIHAAKFALGLGSILPEEIRADLKIKVEREEAEAMDKAIDALSKVDSPIATARIKKWLLNKDTPEYKKEAGLMFMLQKYGVLYAKELTEFQGKFLWYEAFGGRVGDELYNEVKEEAERNNVPFSEEKLMHMLLKRQCKGVLKPERRSRLHKDYEGKWKNGVKEEYEKGYGDASKKRNATEMIKGGMDEAYGGTIPNALGWFKKAVERGDSPEIMSEGFFSLMYSGVLGQQEENVLTEYIKPLWDANGFPIIMIRFATTKGDLDFFNEVVLELSKRISQVDKEQFPDIYNEAKEIFDEVKAGKGTEKERLQKTQKFWKKYGKVLSRALHFQDIGQSETSKTDKLILLEKDASPIFGKYYNMVRVFTGIAGAFNKELMDDESGEHGLGGLNHNEIIKRFFRMDSGRSIPSKNISVVERLWKKISEDINSLKGKDMEINGGDNDINKRKYLKLILRDIFAGFITNHPDKIFLKKYVDASPFKDDMKKWGVTEDIIARFLNYSSGEILAGARGSDEIIDLIIDNILSGNSNNNSSSIFDAIDEVKEEVEGKIETDS